jgi:hypothetical protein
MMTTTPPGSNKLTALEELVLQEKSPGMQRWRQWPRMRWLRVG